MAFIKIGNTVINTDYIVAVELDRISISGKCSVVISVVAKGGLFKRKPREFWFYGEAAKTLRDYFGDFNNVTELLQSSSRSQARQRRRLEQRIRSGRSLVPPVNACKVQNWDDESPELPKLTKALWEEAENWDDPPSDFTDDPPPRPTIRRRPWGPQPPDPLSAAASVEQFNPPIP